MTHSQVSFLRFPMVEGMVPDRSLLSRRLGRRRRRRGGEGGGRGGEQEDRGEVRG